MEGKRHHDNPVRERRHAFTLEKFNGRTLSPSVTVYLPYNLTTDAFESLLSGTDDGKPAFDFPALKNWLNKLYDSLEAQQDPAHPFHSKPYKLRELNIEAADFFHSRKLGFMKLQSKVDNGDKDGWVPGAVFLRGGSVAILPEGAEGEGEKQVILTVQPRVAATSLAFVEIPAGMVDSSGSFSGKAADEIKEETGLEVRENELLDMTKLALQDVQPDFPSATVSLQDAMYPSPGACDESITLFLCQKRLTRRNLQNLEGKMTGLEKEGEKIRLKLVPLNRLWKDAARDGKALAALSLYDNLKREGKIPDMPKKAEQKPKDLHAESSE